VLSETPLPRRGAYGLRHVGCLARLLKEILLIFLPSLHSVRNAYRDLHMLPTAGAADDPCPRIENEKVVTAVDASLRPARAHWLAGNGRDWDGRIASALSALAFHETPGTDLRAALHVCNAMTVERITKSEFADRQIVNLREDDRLLAAGDRNMGPLDFDPIQRIPPSCDFPLHM
jgi:hypothetical protein